MTPAAGSGLFNKLQSFFNFFFNVFFNAQLRKSYTEVGSTLSSQALLRFNCYRSQHQKLSVLQQPSRIQLFAWGKN